MSAGAGPTAQGEYSSGKVREACERMRILAVGGAARLGDGPALAGQSELECWLGWPVISWVLLWACRIRWQLSGTRSGSGGRRAGV